MFTQSATSLLSCIWADLQPPNSFTWCHQARPSISVRRYVLVWRSFPPAGSRLQNTSSPSRISFTNYSVHFCDFAFSSLTRLLADQEVSPLASKILCVVIGHSGKAANSSCKFTFERRVLAIELRFDMKYMVIRKELQKTTHMPYTGRTPTPLSVNIAAKPKSLLPSARVLAARNRFTHSS
jgi:hypothetical protein